MDLLKSCVSHVVVLMLENRSFDTMLGGLFPGDASFKGLTGQESNPWSTHPAASPIRVWNAWPFAGPAPAPLTVPTPDPGELWTDINQQIFGDSAARGAATMQGFVDNYVLQKDEPDARAIMHYYAPSELPVLSSLARQYAVCDEWHASAPCQTWPNRFFVHTGTAGGWENNAPVHLPDLPTIFDRFADPACPYRWKIYFHDIPQSLTLRHLWSARDRFSRFDEDFARDAAAGLLPAYSFIEPRYFTEFELPNDQHPPHNVRVGEQMIARVYNALRAAPTWPQTLLVIIYDEHGGCFDHVVPPPAIPPEAPRATQTFAFDRYGVRVPAVIVSPHIRPGTRLRATPGSQPFDHTSVIATLRARFDLGAPLTQRDAGAPTLAALLAADGPQNNQLDSIPVPQYVATPDEIEAALARPLTDMQHALTQLAELLDDENNVVLRAYDRVKHALQAFAERFLGRLRPRVRQSAPQVRSRTSAFLARPKK